jgi:TRAP-type C4-dicarboxylate transport system substrate-binding protein
MNYGELIFRKEVSMKSNKWFFIASVVFSLIPCLFLPAHAAEQKAITLTYSNFFIPQEIQAKLGEAWAKEIEKRTNGKIKITYYAGGRLLKGEQTFDGVLKGASDIGMSAFSYNFGAFPVMEAIDLPMGYPSGKVATLVINDFYKKFQPKELAGVKVLYLHAHGPGLLHSKKPVSKLEDLKGMRIRSTGMTASIAKALGAVPVAMSQDNTYEALLNNQVDATFGPMEVLKGWNQAKVIKVTVDDCCVSYTTGMYLLMNLKKWNSLPQDIQKIFDEVSAEWVIKHGEAWDASDQEGRKYTLSLGNKVVSLTIQEEGRWANAIRPVIDSYVNGATKKRLSGREYVETIYQFIGAQTKK